MKDKFTREDHLAADKRMKETTITVQIPYTLSVDTLQSNVVAAIEGGSNYWAHIDAGEHQAGWENYLTAKFKDREGGGKTHRLSIDKLKKGLTVLAEKYPWHFQDIIRESGDATTGDVLVQCALLGDIVYG